MSPPGATKKRSGWPWVRWQPGLISESLGYDALNRLETVTRTAGGQNTVTMQLGYEPNGNIRTKMGTGNEVGTYSYGTGAGGASGGGPHAVVGIAGGEQYHYDAVGNLDCRNWNADPGSPGCYPYNGITWFSDNLPQRIYFPGQGGANYADFAYGPDRQRVRQTVVTASPAENKSIYYIEDYFEVEAVDNVPVRYRSNVFFDAYGQRRELDWRNDADHSTYGEAHWIERGYTGHEMLDNVELIHMNGRVQNPLWGRMLSPDPVLADLELPQGLNPYSYVGNNPASRVDPTGLTAEIIVTGRMCAAMCDPGDIEAFAREMQARLDEQAGRFLERVSTAMMTRLDAAAKGVQAVVSARLAAVEKGMEKQSQISYCRTAAMLGVSVGGQLAAAVPALGGFLGVDVTANPFNLQVGITVYGGGGVNVLPTAGVLASVGWGGSWGLQTNGASQGVGGIAFAGAGPGASMSIFRSASSEGGAASGGRVGSRGAEGFALGAAAIGGDYGSKTFANEGVCHE